MNYLRDNCSTTYNPQLDHSMKVSQMELKPKTRTILAIIYRKYWCDTLFDNKNGKNNNNELIDKNEKTDITVRKTSIIKKIINKMKGLFK